MLKETLHDDMVAAMKAGDKFSTGVLRSMVGAIQTAEKSQKTAQDFTDEQAQAVLSTEAKKRAQAAMEYDSVGVAERAEQERAEETLIRTYLPVPLTEDEIRAIVREEVAAQPGANFGAIMKATTTRTKGRADGKVVAALAKAELGN